MKSSHRMRTCFALLIIFLLLTTSSFSTQAQEEEEERWEEYIELTGTLNYILFGLAVLILPWKYIYKSWIKRTDKENNFRDKLRSLHSLMKNLHYFVGTLAALVITFHAYLVISKWNLALIGGLLLVWFYVITGVPSLVKKVLSRVKKWTYPIHRSKTYLIITAILLYLGHVLGD